MFGAVTMIKFTIAKMYFFRIFSRFEVIYSFLFLFLKKPVKSIKFILKSLFHQMGSIVENFKQIESLTDTEKYETTQDSLSIIIFNDRSVDCKSHNLSAPLIVSLTSYALRFSTLPLTLKCLLTQSMKPDKLLLWIAHEDKKCLTHDILKLQEFGLEIDYCPDIGSFKKIIPTLKKYPDHFIVTADDDLYYWPTWLEGLVTTWNGNIHDIVAHRVHKIRVNKYNFPLEYHKWSLDDTDTQKASPLNFATGCGGSFYPPGTFHGDILKVHDFQQLCPKADDVWLYWMSRLNKSMVRRTSNNYSIIFWPGSQRIKLCESNLYQNRNDVYIKAMIDKYGFPI